MRLNRRADFAVMPTRDPSVAALLPCMDPNADSPAQDRRAFLSKASAVVIGGSLVVAPVVAGLCVALDPLRRKSEAGASVLVATLNSLPEDGEPRKFSVLATRVDAWNRTPNVPIGAVYLQRLKDNKVRALNVVWVIQRCGLTIGTHPCDVSRFHKGPVGKGERLCGEFEGSDEEVAVDEDVGGGILRGDAYRQHETDERDRCAAGDGLHQIFLPGSRFSPAV